MNDTMAANRRRQGSHLRWRKPRGREEEDLIDQKDEDHSDRGISENVQMTFETWRTGERKFKGCRGMSRCSH